MGCLGSTVVFADIAAPCGIVHQRTTDLQVKSIKENDNTTSIRSFRTMFVISV